MSEQEKRWRSWARAIQCCAFCFDNKELQERFVDVPDYKENPEVVMIGEAPSLWRMTPGETFGGKSKEVFEALLSAMGMSRSSVYTTNTVKCTIRRKYCGNPKHCIWWLWDELEHLGAKTAIVFGRQAIENIGGPKDLKLMSGEFVLRDIRFLTYPHPMSAVYKSDFRSVYLEKAEGLKERLDVNPTRLTEFVGSR